mmetsp:Transcript_33627/g.54123  ORF Transcript_33627/g.54123 Transcript_33627/m.54123 type:complete len:206 (+) Transcript_33627:453-1070(+)
MKASFGMSSKPSPVLEILILRFLNIPKSSSTLCTSSAADLLASYNLFSTPFCSFSFLFSSTTIKLNRTSSLFRLSLGSPAAISSISFFLIPAIKSSLIDDAEEPSPGGGPTDRSRPVGLGFLVSISNFLTCSRRFLKFSRNADATRMRDCLSSSRVSVDGGGMISESDSDPLSAAGAGGADTTSSSSLRSISSSSLMTLSSLSLG